MKISKIWLLSFVFFLIGNYAIFAGAGQQSSAGTSTNESSILNPLGQTPLLKEKINLTMGMVRSPLTTDMVDNYKTKTLENDSNIHLDFVYYGASSTEAQQKLELEIMAGGTELPDIINFGLDSIAQGLYGSQGMLIPLDNYINTSSYWMKDGIKEMPYDPWKYVRSSDGKIYSLFNYAGEFVTEVYSRFYTNTVWLNDAGLSMPTTLKGFEDMLRAFKNRAPNKDGTKTYPFLTERTRIENYNVLGTLIGPFIYLGNVNTNRYFYKEDNGTISPAFTTDQWRAALTWIRSLVDDNLIDPLSFTIDEEQIKSIGSATSEYAIGCSSYYPLNYIPLSDPRADNWCLIGPFSGFNGGDPVPMYTQNMPDLCYNITKNCKYPEAAFRMGDLMMSEKFSVIGRWGEEGVDWVKPAATDTTYFPGVAPYLIPIAVWGTPTNKLWAQSQGPAIKPYKIFNGSYVQGRIHYLDLWAAEMGARAIQYIHPEKVIGTIVYTQAEYEKIAEIRSNVESYILECFSRFMLRDMSLENDWDKYLTELKNMGLDTYVQTARTAYVRMNQQ